LRTAEVSALLFLAAGLPLYLLSFALSRILSRRLGKDHGTKALLLMAASVLPPPLAALVVAAGMGTAFFCPFCALPHASGPCPLPLPHFCLHSSPLLRLLPLVKLLGLPSLLLLILGVAGYAAATVAAHLFLPLPRASALFGVAMPDGLPPALAKKALRHEAIHLARKDHLASLLVELGRALFFWLPPARSIALAWRGAVEEAASGGVVGGRLGPSAALGACSLILALTMLPSFHCAAEALLGLWP